LSVATLVITIIPFFHRAYFSSNRSLSLIPPPVIMSWKLGKSKKATLTADRDDAASIRSITPTPGDDKPHFRTGILSIRVLWAEGLSVPQGTSVPAVVQAALSSQQAKVAASISPASVSQSRLAVRGKRDSIQRTQCWWLPYIVMEFEVNQILITPLGGELDKPLYMYQAHLYVCSASQLLGHSSVF
jgi:serum/glucocorticoid-regulated kinase 2